MKDNKNKDSITRKKAEALDVFVFKNDLGLIGKQLIKQEDGNYKAVVKTYGGNITILIPSGYITKEFKIFKELNNKDKIKIVNGK